jgi:hypothetical protein
MGAFVSIPKRKPYRNRKLLNLAHELNACTLRFQGICIGYSVEGLEPAHSNFLEHGKAKGQKADDDQHCAACHWCHAELDQGHRFSLEAKRSLFASAREETFREYQKRGWLDRVGYVWRSQA